MRQSRRARWSGHRATGTIEKNLCFLTSHPAGAGLARRAIKARAFTAPAGGEEALTESEERRVESGELR